MSQEMNVRAIGSVQATNAGFALALRPEYGPALQGLAGFSHVLVLWWAHEADTADDRERLIYTKPYTRNPDDVGVFGSRSPSRPNPIGLSVAAVGRIDMAKAMVEVPYIDTEIGTPLLDIKPYYPASDRVQNPSVPAWCKHWPKSYEASAEFDWATEFE